MQRIVSLFPLWVLTASLLSLYHPPLFTWFSGNLITIGLGVVLARQNFSSPLVAIPSAISSLFHSLIASMLAGLWRKKDYQNELSEERNYL
jgi:predicted Na+-dependent transporter